MKQSYALAQLFRLAIVLLIGASFAACEGPMGPVGPQGEKGEKGDRGERGERGFRGESANSPFILIEMRLNEDAWNEELASYYLHDPRIQPATVAEVYVKRFYTNTGDAYYLSILDWLLVEDLDGEYSVDTDPVIVQVSSGQVRFYDPDRRLLNEVVAVAITLP